MALGDPYASAVELAEALRIGDSDDDIQLELAVDTASTWVRDYCSRDFNQADTASARVFYPDSRDTVPTDDISTTTGLIVKTDDDDDGTFETTWDAADYQLEPLNGVHLGVTGWPYTHIRAVESKRFPVGNCNAPVQITARWGWAAVRSTVKTATLIQAARLYKRRDSAEGVLGGFGDFGPVRVGTRLDPDVQEMLWRYRKTVGGLA